MNHKVHTLLDYIRLNNRSGFSATCGGRGTCGKCRVKVIKGDVSPPSPFEKTVLSPQEQTDGIRLACQTIITGALTDIVLEITGEDAYSVVTNMEMPDTKHDDPHSPNTITTPTISTKVAVDLGTTTIAVTLVDPDRCLELDTWTAVNAQRSYGADIISRIQYCSYDPLKLEELQQILIQQLEQGILYLLEAQHLDPRNMSEIVVAGNTTMLHLLCREDPSGIAVSPFTPRFTDSRTYSAADLGFTVFPKTSVLLLPGISAFVGADILAGIVSVNLAESDSPTLFLDIGTNGESVLFDGKDILCCSSAAGPAFEGGNITCGTGSIRGAIESIELNQGGLRISTIGNKDPVGLCGSGIIDAAALLVDSGVADSTGLMRHPGVPDIQWIEVRDGGTVLRLTGEDMNGIVFTQKDLRQVQMAKAAIAAGIRCLFQASSISINSLERVILAGGFGNCIRPLSAGTIGLLPDRLSEITISAGNTSLKGALQVIFHPETLHTLHRVRDRCLSIELSGNPCFNDLFIEEMSFPQSG